MWVDLACTDMEGEVEGETNGNRPKIPSCIEIFDRFWYCASPVSQLNQYYRHGEIEDCSILLSDWSKCMRAKLHKDEEKKYEIMASASVMIPIVENHVWEYKEKPGWSLENSGSSSNSSNSNSKKQRTSWWWGAS